MPSPMARLFFDAHAAMRAGMRGPARKLRGVVQKQNASFGKTRLQVRVLLPRRQIELPTAFDGDSSIEQLGELGVSGVLLAHATGGCNSFHSDDASECSLMTDVAQLGRALMPLLALRLQTGR